MEMSSKEISSGEEYINFVEKFVTLLDKEFKLFEEVAADKNSIHEIVSSMPALISLVNTVGYLRGQDGLFLDTRPQTNQQKKLYEYEDLFESRLNKLIKLIMQSDSQEYYKERLESYFIRARSN